jgi:hypothetical protein
MNPLPPPTDSAALTCLPPSPGFKEEGVEGGYKQIVIAAAKGSEAALTIFEDLINPYWKKQAQGTGLRA